ncbi:MAG TPA: glycosyltransferase family 39 protein [Acidobacteriaceae bacterium]|nr:glycosyltransferase family 39 protein [Acidobacteriaceae bacterium]
MSRSGTSPSRFAAVSGRVPAWAVFPLTFAAIWLAHWPLLRLPYYWDEAGYYIPAAFDFFRKGALIPYSTLSNAHPPLPSIFLAAFWKLFGFHPFVTRSTMCLFAALALTAVWRIAFIVSQRRSIAFATLFLTAIYPVFFAQSSLAHADMFAAAATLWAIVFFVQRKLWPAVFFFSLAALCKETAIITPLALAAWMLYRALRTRSAQPICSAVQLALPVLPLMLWYAYYWRRTGFLLGNPEYLKYNATSTLTPLRFAVALWHRVNQLTLHMDLFVPVLLALACLLLDPLPESDNTPRPPFPRASRDAFLVIILANLFFFSLIGGALLTRYMLPLYPLVILFCVAAFHRHARRWHWFIAFSAGAFIAALFINPPYRFAPEDNLAYSDFIHLQQAAVQQIVTRYPGETVLTAWPATDELTRPELGYVTHPIPVTAINNFSYSQIQRAAQPGQHYSVGLIFATKYSPRRSLLFGRFNRAMDSRYFGFHYDLPPALIARLLGGHVVWQQQRKGLWAAVIHFDRPQVAHLCLPTPSTPSAPHL